MLRVASTSTSRRSIAVVVAVASPARSGAAQWGGYLPWSRGTPLRLDQSARETTRPLLPSVASHGQQRRHAVCAATLPTDAGSAAGSMADDYLAIAGLFAAQIPTLCSRGILGEELHLLPTELFPPIR